MLALILASCHSPYMATTGANCISEEIAARQSVNDNLYKFDHRSVWPSTAEHSLGDDCKFDRLTPHTVGTLFIRIGRRLMTNASETHVQSDLVVRVWFYLLGAACLVFVAMLLLVGVHPW
jgi:hypothetical protein